MMRLAILLLVVGCYSSDDEDQDAGCTPDACSTSCAADGRDGGACITAPPDDPVACVCF